MRITKVSIEKLHGNMNYNINFNNDVTFLFGDNGCGKTTVLNIITSIITGKIYELFSYEFESISLFYNNLSPKKNSNKIIIKQLGDDISISLSNTEDAIHLKRNEYHSRSEEINVFERERYYYTEYPILDKIKNTFNYVYFPLNRNVDYDDSFLSFAWRRKNIQLRYTDSSYPRNNSDLVLLNVKALVKDSFNAITRNLNIINENLNEEIIDFYLDIDNASKFEENLKVLNNLTEGKIEDIRKDYLKAIKVIKKKQQNSDGKINAFFDELIKELNKYKNEKSKSDILISLLFKLSELGKITSIIKKVESAEQEKQKANQLIESFISTVNKFVSNNNSKKIVINSVGEIQLETTAKKEINIIDLSSGEKQIVTFFAYLLFALQQTEQNIYIVDEPELSLHLSWQKQFVDSILEINNDIQLIFATHSPEIIGRYRQKAVKLMPTV